AAAPIDESKTSKTSFRACLFAPCAQAPRLIEKVSIDNLSGILRSGGSSQVDNRPVGKLRHLSGVVQVVVVPERETAVENYVSFRVERVGVNQYDAVLLCRVALVTDNDLRGIPADRQPIGDSFKDGIRRRVSPQHKIRAGDIVVVDLCVVFDA